MGKAQQTLTLSVPRELTNAALSKSKQEGVVLSHVVRSWLRSWLAGAIPTPGEARQLPLIPLDSSSAAMQEYLEGRVRELSARAQAFEGEVRQLNKMIGALQEADSGEDTA